MIKITPKYSEDFLFDYSFNVINNKVLPKRNELSDIVPVDIKSRFIDLFNNQFLSSLILCDAVQLREMIDNIYNTFPILSERFCLEFLLKELTLTEEEANTHLRGKVNKARVVACHSRIINELKAIIQNYSSILIQSHIDKMELNTTEHDMRESLRSIYSMMSGNFKYSEKVIDSFPVWVNDFPKMFNYEYVSKNFGHRIVSEVSIDICPYCNNEDIEQIHEKGAEDRPDLDHYFPKSKFPFLAVTLSNLIPSGNRCNQTYKRSHWMFKNLHPYVDGINQNVLFNTKYAFDTGRTIDNITISLINQNNDLDNNMNLFKIKEVYSKKKIKKWFLDLHERFDLLLNVDKDSIYDIIEDSTKIKTRLCIDDSIPLYNEEFQKFKLDSLKQIIEDTIAIDN
ncbi:TPA: hypothetical protein ACX6PK_000777 [Photobacterium damselae]